MKPVISTAKRPSSFTIESIIGTERGKSSHFQNDDTPRRLSFGNRDIENRVPLPHQEFLPQLNRLYQDLAISSQVFTQPWGVYPSSMAPGSVSGQGQCSLLAPAPVNPFLFNRPSETTQLHPWLFARQGLSYHLPGCTDPGFLFHPYRKPKRIRTAFSPSQLLKLDDAFDKNHYIVGQERKELATKLGLTETQVKVWFQNRRTKYKRIKAEQDSISPSNRQSEKCVRENSVNDDSDSEDENEIVDVS